MGFLVITKLHDGKSVRREMDETILGLFELLIEFVFWKEQPRALGNRLQGRG